MIELLCYVNIIFIIPGTAILPPGIQFKFLLKVFLDWVFVTLIMVLPQRLRIWIWINDGQTIDSAVINVFE